MQTNFKKISYDEVFQNVGPIAATLVPDAAPAVVAEFYTAPINRLSINVNVGVADLTGFEVWTRTDQVGAPWLPFPLDKARARGRSDPGTDVTTTPAGASCFVTLDIINWSDVQIRLKSAGASELSITAGGK